MKIFYTLVRILVLTLAVIAVVLICNRSFLSVIGVEKTDAGVWVRIVLWPFVTVVSLICMPLFRRHKKR